MWPRPSQEIIMALSGNAFWTTARVYTTASALAAMSWTSEALASQGPGTSQGTASNFTQLAMAILVYGAALLVIGASLIRAARRH
jgi:hypothetical protein